MKFTFQQKLTFSYIVIFVVFTIGVALFEQHRAKIYKADALKERLDAYSDLVYSSLAGDKAATSRVDSLLALLPDSVRLTIVQPNGELLYDNHIAVLTGVSNHNDRPEIADAKRDGSGAFIRLSSSTNKPYLYYAKYYGDLFVRVALPYNIRVQSLLQPEADFLYFITLLFIAGLLFIHLVGRRFGGSIRDLRDFSLSLATDGPAPVAPRFHRDEIGEIGEQIVLNYYNLRQRKEQLSQEREKLLQHVQSSAEGICFFTPDGRVAFYNGLFLQYVNALSCDTVARPGDIMDNEVFAPVNEFLASHGDENYYETHIAKNGKEFFARVNIFADGSYEVVLNDITAQENTRNMKREMTGNIAHELRTPVTSIRGYLETVLDNNLDKEKERHYLERAFAQTKNLSELISDMSLLTKIEQNESSFARTEIKLLEVVDKVKNDLAESMAGKGIAIETNLQAEIVYGNANLLYSIFRNLADNVIRYAGDGVTIWVNKVGIADGRIHLSFADNGVGIADESHLANLFERFYRISEGRTRDSGGSGLGLSIVKNAVAFHGGNITAKNRAGGGLEFIFDLPLK